MEENKDSRANRKATWYKELDSHIKCFHAAAKQRKTILITGPHLYQVVTRVNKQTTDLWIEHANKIIETLKSDKYEKQRFCWLTEQKNYRKELMGQLKRFHDPNPPK